MTLSTGTYLGQYEILEPIGAGGMGEVYRARDTKLGREVAIKVLPPGFAGSPESLARFEREARLLASLNHPNIAILHGFEQSGGTHFLVMELVPGETLGERILRGPVPIKEALPLFQQLAEALEAAHEKGVIHRDLKPANIKITEDGKLKVLDFGLAKAFGEDLPPADLSQSPTITRQGTVPGVILGTAGYMSPEQARGKTLDKRTDIWSFGCVLYETLAGRPPFPGETLSDTIARILEREPDWDALPDDTPPYIRLLLNRCLRKDSRERLHDIADARIEIRDATSAPYAVTSTGELIAAAPQPKSGWKQAVPWSIAAASFLTAVALVTFWSVRSSSPPEKLVSRSFTTLPPGQTMQEVGHYGSAVALSADGTQLVYVAREGDTTRLYRRSMDAFDAEVIPGTENAWAPFLSPDGSWVGFYSGGEDKGDVKKVSLEGGGLSVICPTDQGRHLHGGTWGPDGNVYFGHCVHGIEKISAMGGATELITKAYNSPDERNPFYPQLLPGGEVVLFTIWNDSKDSRIAVYDLTTGERRIVHQPGSYGRYVPTGHLVYAWEGELLAVPFDLEELRVTGLPVRVLENVLMEELYGVAHFSVSNNGSLVYVPGGMVRLASIFAWVDRTGEVEPLSFPPSQFGPRISHDGNRVLVGRPSASGTGADIWVYDLERGVERPVTDEQGSEYWAIWTPDGERIVYNSFREGRTLNLYWKPADGSGPEELLAETEHWLQPYSFSADGKLLAYQESNHPTNGFDIWVLSMEERRPRPFLQSKHNEIHPALSPDGRWMAYASNESGRYEVNVRSYPGPGVVTQVSADGGFEPIWSPDGREIYYRTQEGKRVMAVEFTPDAPTPRLGKPRLLFEGRFAGLETYGRRYDLAPDGERFLMLQENEPPPPPTQYNVVLNWFEELKRLVPTEVN
jgi:serine/threonine protein kinase/Tol biopolymer transport system component